eukprot:753374-Hanusia_phi.AAC.5
MAGAGKLALAVTLIAALMVKGSEGSEVQCGSCTLNVTAGVLDLQGSCENDCKFLDLRNLQIQEIPAGLFAGLSALQKVDLTNNLLTQVPSSALSNNTMLTTLILRSNSISSISNTDFVNLTSLVDLDISKNQLSSLSTGWAESLSSLLYLNISYNKLTMLSEGDFTGLVNLQKLDLSSNVIESIAPTTLDPVIRLIYLNLASNQISWLNGTLPMFENMTVLDLSYNSLTILDSAIFNFTVSIINISHNNLTCIAYNAFSMSVQAIYLAGNPLTCLDPMWNTLVRDYSSLNVCTAPRTCAPGEILPCSTSGDQQMCGCDAGYHVVYDGTYKCQPCPSGTFQSQFGVDNCTACTMTPCAIGQYRTQCQPTGDGICANCTNKMEGPTVYVSSGYPYDSNNCAWDCDAGLMLSMDSACAVSCA